MIIITNRRTYERIVLKFIFQYFQEYIVNVLHEFRVMMREFDLANSGLFFKSFLDPTPVPKSTAVSS